MIKASILVVEDEAVIAEDLADKVRQLGYSVVAICARGEQAVELAGRLGPDLVLMDIQLDGDLDGVEAAREIRQRLDLPVIYLTAHADAPTLARAKVTEPFGYILKPFDEQILSVQLELALYKHRAERELWRQREWLRVTLCSIGDAVLASDSTGRVSFINPVATSLLGWTAGEAEGRPASELFRLVDEQTGETVQDPIAALLAKRQPVAPANHTALLTRDGRSIPVENSASAILDDAGQVLGVVLVFRDVTEERRATEALNASLRELRETQDELVRKERLAVLGKLVGGVAHELRNPLSVIRNSFYFMEHTSPPDDQATRQAMEESRRAITSCDHIISEMLDYVREPSRESSVFPVSAPIEQALRVVPPGGSIKIVRKGLGEMGKVRANEGQISRILTNLVLNAVQAMPEGGDLAVEVTSEDSQQVCVEIRDTGAGISKENLARIFDPLFTTKATGIGLGLAVCKRYAQLNQGELSVASEPGKGASFRLSLPVA